MSTNTGIMNRYPHDIENEFNANRNITILVKQMGTVSNIDKFLTQVSNLAANPNAANLTSASAGAGDASIEIIKQTAKTLGANAGRKFTNLETLWGCVLPLPNELNENQTHQWESTEGIVGSTLGGLADTNFVGGLSIHKALGELANKSAQRKALINPGYFQDYRGTRPREFNFTWDLIPNSKIEADQIYAILLRLKKYTLPATLKGSGGLGLSSPYLFDIIVGNKRIRTLMNMNNVVCTNMSIGYSADNSLQMFGDGTPKHMTLQMSFAEKSTVLASDYPE